MALDKEEIGYKATLDTDNYVKGQEKIQNETKESNEKIQKGNKKNVDSYGGLNKSLKKLVLAGGGFFILQKVLSKIVQIGKASLGIFSRQEMAFRGLNKVAKAYNQDTNEAAEAAKTLSEDGLIPLTSSIRTLKNLLGTGYSVAEAMQIAEDMKQIGKFNRVVDDLGQAMEDSSKGIKTNSIELIENVGLTERLSVTMEKANVSIRKGINLTDNLAQREAFLNSIRSQAAKFADDGTENTETYGESVGKLNTAMKSLGATFGKILAPAAKAVNKTLTSAAKATDKFLSGETNQKAIDKRREQLREYKIGLSNSATSERDLYKKREESQKLHIKEQQIIFEEQKRLSDEKEDYVSSNEQMILNKMEKAQEKEINDTIRINAEKEKQLEKEKEMSVIRQGYKNQELSSIYNVNEEIMRNENAAKEKKETDLTSERAMINNAHANEMAFLEQAQFERESLRESDTETFEEQEKRKHEIRKKFAVASNAITDKLMKGELDSVDDLKEIVNLQLQAMAHGKVAEMSITAVTEGVLSAASFASGNATQGAAHASAAGQALTGAAIIGALAGVANRALGGGGDATTTEAGSETVEQASAVADIATEQKPTLTLDISDSNLIPALIPEIDQALQDNWNVSIINK